MSTQRAPWWMYIIAASFLVFDAFVYYQWYFGPADPQGLARASFSEGTMVVDIVAPNSPAEHAGLRAGDRVLAVEGQPLRNAHDWGIAEANLEVGVPQHWEVARGGQTLAVEFTPVRGDWRDGIPDMTVALFALVIGLFVAFQRPHDPLARLGAWFIVTSSVIPK